MATALLSTNKVHDARCALGALIAVRALSFREDEAEYPAALAKLAWDIAEAMATEHARRSHAKGRGK
jgi:hypothetical protein